MNQALVGILMGSISDLDVMRECMDVLKKFGIPHEMEVSSAHRTPERTAQYALTARERGLKAIVVGAGAAAHLGGMVAAHTTLPVIAVPIDSSSLNGLDALLATVQMPAGIPVACMAIGKAGARNAGILVAQILSVADSRLEVEMVRFKIELEQAVLEQSRRLQEQLKS